MKKLKIILAILPIFILCILFFIIYNKTGIFSTYNEKSKSYIIPEFISEMYIDKEPIVDYFVSLKGIDIYKKSDIIVDKIKSYTYYNNILKYNISTNVCDIDCLKACERLYVNGRLLINKLCSDEDRTQIVATLSLNEFYKFKEYLDLLKKESGNNFYSENISIINFEKIKGGYVKSYNSADNFYLEREKYPDEIKNKELIKVYINLVNINTFSRLWIEYPKLFYYTEFIVVILFIIIPCIYYKKLFINNNN